jgi:hypothetical protein
MSRTRRPDVEPEPEAERRPLYARMLRLRHLTPSGLLCFVFLEGAIALGLLLALAELVSWWGVLVLPATVALMVKLNDVIAGSLSHGAALAHQTVARPARYSPAGSFGSTTSQAERYGSATPEADRYGSATAGGGFFSSATPEADLYGSAAPEGDAFSSAAPQIGPYGSAAPHSTSFDRRWPQRAPLNASPAARFDPDEDQEPVSPAAAAFNPPAGGAPAQGPPVRLADAATTHLPRVLDREHDAPSARNWPERAEAQQQWLRQSANRRYQ